MSYYKLTILGDPMSALIQLTLDGSLVHEGHKVSLRVLSHTMAGIQSAADRACLDVTRGNVWKHQRLPRELYEVSDFIVGQPREGSYLIDFLSGQGWAIVSRMRNALREPFGAAVLGAEREIYSISHQIAARKDQVMRGEVDRRYDRDRPDALATRAYSDRSINKEFNQMLTPVRRDPDALLRLVMQPSQDDFPETFEFNQQVAVKFKEIISTRQLGEAAIYHGKLRELDRGNDRTSNFRGKFIISTTKKNVVLRIESIDDFERLVPYLRRDEVTIVACPIIEFASHDPMGGDIQFIEICDG